MENLIVVHPERNEITVSGRQLHEKLGIQTEYRHWFPRMCGYGFEEGMDFNPVKIDRVQYEGLRKVSREVIDHELSIDMAKEICMLARTPVGKSVRKYFLDMEKAWNSPEQVMARALQMANQSMQALQEQCLLMQNQVIEQQLMLEELAPKAKYLDQILQSPSLVLTTQIAKDYGMSATRFNRILHDMKIQYKVNDQWILYANYQGKGYVHSRTITIPRNDGTCLVRMQTEWTQEGRRFLYEELKEKRGILPLIEGGGGHAGRS